MTRGERRRDALIAVALFGLFGTLYWAGRSRSFGMGDSPQHALSALLWAVPHPPGYPLLTALGWLWSRLPWSDSAAAVNGLSGIFSAGAAAVLFLLLRSGGLRRATALIGVALMALSPLLWYYALIAEARALNDLLTVAAAYFAFAWSRAATPRSLLAFSLLFGLGLSHHPSYVFLIPAYAVWLSARRPSARLSAGALALVALGLAGPYLLLGLRLQHSAPLYNLFEIRGWSDLWPLFTRARIGGAMRMANGVPLLGSVPFDFGSLATHIGWLLSSLWLHGGPVALALSALGAAALWNVSRRDLAAWALWFCATAGTYILFSSQQMPAVDPEYARAVATRFHLLPLIAVFALAAFGAEALARRVRPAFIATLLATVFVAPLALRPQTLAHENPLLDYTRAMMRDSGPRDFIVLGGDDTIFSSLYLELVQNATEQRVLLCPTMFAFPPYLRRLQKTYPEVAFPPLGPQGLSTDWALWKKMNPGRAVLVEPSLLGGVLSQFPASVPQGALVRIESFTVKIDPAADARRFLDAPETFAIARRQSREWTQEVYLLQARKRMAEWLASRLNPHRDREILMRLSLLMGQL